MFKEVYLNYKKNKKEIINQKKIIEDNRLENINLLVEYKNITESIENSKKSIDQFQAEIKKLEINKHELEKRIKHLNINEKKMNQIIETKEETIKAFDKKNNLLYLRNKELLNQIELQQIILRDVLKVNEELDAINFVKKGQNILKNHQYIIKNQNIGNQFLKYYLNYLAEDDLLKLYIKNFCESFRELSISYVFLEEKLKKNIINIADEIVRNKNYDFESDKDDLLMTLINTYFILIESFPEITFKKMLFYIECECLLQFHFKTKDEYHLIEMSKIDNEEILTFLFNLYGENIFKPELIAYLCIELINRNIYWNYSDVNEFKNKLKEEYQKNKQKNVIKIAKNEINSVEESLNLNDLNKLTGIEFEEFLIRVFLKLGYNVDQTKTTGDQGADLIVSNQVNRIAVQAKRYTSNVGNSAVQEVLAGKAYYNCDSAIVVTTSDFTNSAIAVAQKANVLLWNGKHLISLIRNLNIKKDRDIKKSDNKFKDKEYLELLSEKSFMKTEIRALKNKKLELEEEVNLSKTKVNIQDNLKNRVKKIEGLESSNQIITLIDQLIIKKRELNEEILEKEKKLLELTKLSANFIEK